MGTSRSKKKGSWFGIVRKTFFKASPHETIIVLHTNNTSSSFGEEATATAAARKEEGSDEIIEVKNIGASPSLTEMNELLSEEEVIAAIVIQAYFRRHLARRAFRALRSLVKLQAVVRGVCVRRQARMAMHCMHALTRLQVTVRARQLLSRCSED
ncbi:hypothetical protein RJ639_039697 [Escallonia herrerae]|uniref:Uncharacterized protein n=1 Tax=Escallonia herrerae TaxID=1293975 RepID=A0AA88WKB7_9ASTE|nr:hypothetical protein RJ639_039697 [Escallonia herrerae]